jgi:hypothetical protein
VPVLVWQASISSVVRVLIINHGGSSMSACIKRRTLLAGLAAMPALGLVGCGFDRTTAGPISTVDTLVRQPAADTGAG